MPSNGVRSTPSGRVAQLDRVSASEAGAHQPDTRRTNPPAGLTLTPIRRGAPYTRRAERSFGFVRDRAPTDGFAWDAGEACGFIPLKDVQAATVDLKLAQERRP
jgi:hypothetical protein